MNIKMVLIRMFIILFGIVIALVGLKLLDIAVGFTLNKMGYYKAMSPSITEMYSTSEFYGAYKTSSQGIRNGEVKIPKPKGIYRILAIGDSFTYGFGVNDGKAWPALLEKKLQSDFKIEVINAGAPGLDPYNEISVCKAYADQFNVDMIVMGLYSTEDLYQAAAVSEKKKNMHDIIGEFFENLASIKRPIITLPLATSSNSIPPGTITDNSRLWQVVANEAVSDNPELIKILNHRVYNYFISGQLNAFLITEALRDTNHLIKILDKNEQQKQLSAFAISMEKLKNECLGKKPAMVVLLPSEELVSKDFFQYRNKVGYRTDPRLVNIDLDNLLKPIVSKSSVSYISLLNKFRKDNCIKCFYPWDGHMTEYGNKEVAEFIYPSIKKMVEESMRSKE